MASICAGRLVATSYRAAHLASVYCLSDGPSLLSQPQPPAIRVSSVPCSLLLSVNTALLIFYENCSSMNG